MKWKNCKQQNNLIISLNRQLYAYTPAFAQICAADDEQHCRPVPQETTNIPVQVYFDYSEYRPPCLYPSLVTSFEHELHKTPVPLLLINTNPSVNAISKRLSQGNC